MDDAGRMNDRFSRLFRIGQAMLLPIIHCRR
jgi:hypothetical protein